MFSNNGGALVTKGRTFIMNSGGGDGNGGGDGSTDCVIFNGAYGGGRIMYRNAAGVEAELGSGGGGGAVPDPLVLQNSITSVTGDLVATAGNVTAGTDVSATVNVTAGPLAAPTVVLRGVTGECDCVDVTSSGTITCTNGPESVLINGVSGQIIATGAISSGGDVTATAGNFQAPNGDVSCGTGATAITLVGQGASAGTANCLTVEAATKLATPQLDIMAVGMGSAITEVSTSGGETTFRTPAPGSVHFANTSQDVLSITSSQATFRRPPACLAVVGAGAPSYVFNQDLFDVVSSAGGNFLTTIHNDLTQGGVATSTLVQVSSSTAVGGGAGLDSLFTSVYPTQAGVAAPQITFNNGTTGPADAQGARDNFLSTPAQRYTCSRWRIIFKQVGTLSNALGNAAVQGFSAYCDIDIDDFPAAGTPQILKFKEMQYSTTFNNLITQAVPGSGTNTNIDNFGLVRLARRPQVILPPAGYQFFIDFPGWDLQSLAAGAQMALTCQMLKLP